MNEQKPSVGRVVHYVSHGTPVQPDGSQAYASECRAATVTAVGAWITVNTTKPDSFSRSEGRPIRNAEQWFFDDALALMVANPTGQFFNEAVRYDPAMKDGQPIGEGTELCDGRAHAGGTWHWPERV